MNPFRYLAGAGALWLLAWFALLPWPAARADGLIDMGLDLPRKGIADRVSMTKALPPNTNTEFAQLDGPGVIRHLWITPTNQFEGNRQTIIRVYFDHAKVPNVEAPVGDFFGVMHGREFYDLNS